VRFNYTEFLVGGGQRAQSVTIPFLTENAASLSAPSTFGGNATKSGADFYRGIASRVVQNSDVRYRAIGRVDFIISAAGEDLTTLLDIGDPVSDVGQVRPTFSNINYTNVDGETAIGIGIFSSRGQYVREKLLYDSDSNELEEMVNGQYTSELCFCDTMGVSIEFGCTNEANYCQ